MPAAEPVPAPGMCVGNGEQEPCLSLVLDAPGCSADAEPIRLPGAVTSRGWGSRFSVATPLGAHPASPPFGCKAEPAGLCLIKLQILVH